MEALKRLFGFSVEEDPLKREIEEMRKAAKTAIKEAEKAGKMAGKRARRVETKESGESGGRGSGWSFLASRGSSEPKGSGGLSKAVEEVETIFSEIEGFGG